MRLTLLLCFCVFYPSFCPAQNNMVSKQNVKVTTDAIAIFIKKHPALADYEREIVLYYKKNEGKLAWFDDGLFAEYAYALENKLREFSYDGIFSALPYHDEVNAAFSAPAQTNTLATDILLTSVYFYYSERIYGGIDDNSSRITGWYIPRKSHDYCSYLDSLVAEKHFVQLPVHSQYQKLRKALAKYLTIEKNGGWDAINLPEGFTALNPGDSSSVIIQIRRRLFTEGYLTTDSKSGWYDDTLETAIKAYKVAVNFADEATITKELTGQLNIPVEERIRCIAVNMERCRWLEPDVKLQSQFIAVNIPSFSLVYFIDGIPCLTSRVIVGKQATKTVVFTGEMSYIVFSPYWNIPAGILKNEILPQMRKDKNYLNTHDMEWTANGKLRQRPGPENPLGLVKFIFPNSSSIYLHDTPAKHLFSKETRAFSHGCIRVEKAQELAVAILKNDAQWPQQRTEQAMHAEKESIYLLKNKIPVYIAYFTAWADDGGNVSFFEDIYRRDKQLAKFLYDK